MADEIHHTVGERLSSDSQRYTSGRRKLVEVLARAGRPLTTAEILEEGKLSQSSAYRNLAVLETCGVVHRIVSSDEFFRYELDEDLTDHHHHHLICTACGSVADFTVPDRIERSLETVMDQVAESNQFSADHHRLDLFGLCTDCR